MQSLQTSEICARAFLCVVRDSFASHSSVMSCQYRVFYCTSFGPWTRTRNSASVAAGSWTYYVDVETWFDRFLIIRQQSPMVIALPVRFLQYVCVTTKGGTSIIHGCNPRKKGGKKRGVLRRCGLKINNCPSIALLAFGRHLRLWHDVRLIINNITADGHLARA